MSYTEDFPTLGKQINGKPIVYFDNACMTLRPQSVIESVKEYYEEFPACAGRSAHTLAKQVTEKYNEARKITQKFIHAKHPEEVVFTKNTTESLNLVIQSFNFQAGDQIIISDKEHNSNLIPWQLLKNKIGIEILICPSKEDNTFDLDAYKNLLTEKVKMVSLVYTSNLDGTTIPAKEIITLAHDHNILVMLDAAQTIAHEVIDVQNLDVDFMAFSGHKILGPSGTGVLYGKKEHLNNLTPFISGGSTVSYSTFENHHLLETPEKFEAGLQNYAGVLGMKEGIEYLQKVGYETIKNQELELNQYITEELLKEDKVKLIGPKDPALRSSIFSFYLDGMDVHQTAMLLNDNANIMVRSGQHCVHSWFDKNNIEGSVRASFSFYNTKEEAKLFVEEIRKIISII